MEAEVGDVGFIRDSKFHRLFNALSCSQQIIRLMKAAMYQSTTNQFNSA